MFTGRLQNLNYFSCVGMLQCQQFETKETQRKCFVQMSIESAKCRQSRQRLFRIGFFVLSTLLMIGMVWFGITTDFDFGRDAIPGTSFPRGRVIELSSDDTEVDGTGFRRGMQTARVEVLSGEHRGLVVEARNVIFIDAPMYAEVGRVYIIALSEIGVYPDGSPSFQANLHSYVRDTQIYIIGAFFLVLLAVIGGKSGVSSAFGLVFTFVTLLFFLIPAIIRGAPPALATIIVSIVVTAVSLIAIMGFAKKTWVSIVGTVIGIALYCLSYIIIAALLGITGANTPDFTRLMLVGFNDFDNVAQLLFCGILIASLGAVMDTSVSVASATAELAEAGGKLEFRELFKTSMRMARDCVGSSANTLILAFTGTFFVSLILFYTHGLDYTMLINRIDIAIEVLRAISSSIGMVLCAPFTALIGSYAYRRVQGVEDKQSKRKHV